MAERYHLALASWALLTGAALLLLGRMLPERASAHALGAAGFAGALLGGWGSGRALPWVLAAGVVALRADRPPGCHPLGEWVLPATLVSLIGVWAAVPDTEPALAAGCVLAPFAMARVLNHRSAGPAGTAALLVMVIGSVWVGSAGWGRALATLSTVGMVAVAPLVLFVALPLRPRLESRFGGSCTDAVPLLVATVKGASVNFSGDLQEREVELNRTSREKEAPHRGGAEDACGRARAPVLISASHLLCALMLSLGVVT